jgi:hypothetical protein
MTMKFGRFFVGLAASGCASKLEFEKGLGKHGVRDKSRRMRFWCVFGIEGGG